MSDIATYYKEHEAEDAMSVLAGWMGSNSKLRVIYHEGTAVDADIFNGVIRIPKMACASGITQDALMLLRSRVYHEAGHIDETKLSKSEYPEGALHEIWNALEDRRMEAVEADKHKGCEIVFRWAVGHYNRKLAAEMSKTDAPLWEAMCAMSMMVEGVQPAWHLREKAQDYVDAAYSEFIKVKQCKNARGTLKLAEVIYKILKQVNEEWKQSQPQKQPGEQQDKPQQGKGEPQQEEGKQGEDENKEPQQGGSKDFDDYENEKEGKGKDSKGGKKDPDEEEESEGDEESKGSDEESGESEEGEGGKAGKDDDKDGGSKTLPDKDGETGKNKDDEEVQDGTSPSDGDGDGEKGEKESKGGSKKSKPSGDVPADTDEKESKGDGKDKRDLEDEINGISKEQAQNDDLKEFFKNMPEQDKEYTSRRDQDAHSSPETTDDDKTQYQEQLSKVSVAVSAMTHALEQSLRSMSKCRKNPYMRHGKIDPRRLVAIAKGLSKEVFYKTRDGMTLDAAVEIIIDESSSMSNCYYNVRLLAMAIGEALNAIGIPFEITGTTTAYMNGRGVPPLDGFTRTNPIVYKHYKLFNDQWTNVRHRMVHTGNYNHNIDGEAVEYAAFRLAQRRERRKVIFSLSDGEPYSGHGESNNMEMCVNLKRVCDRVRKQGIDVFGFGLGTDKPGDFYSDKWFVYLKDVLNMGQEFVREFSRIITEGKVKV